MWGNLWGMLRNYQKFIGYQRLLAERVGFEPTVCYPHIPSAARLCDVALARRTIALPHRTGSVLTWESVGPYDCGICFASIGENTTIALFSCRAARLIAWSSTLSIFFLASAIYSRSERVSNILTPVRFARYAPSLASGYERLIVAVHHGRDDPHT
jgi:hypothetical protein